jgi:hypothetical protein
MHMPGENGPESMPKEELGGDCMSSYNGYKHWLDPDGFCYGCGLYFGAPIKKSSKRNTPEPVKINYESMGYWDLAKDKVAGPILERRALDYLRKNGGNWFTLRYTGELDESGRLIQTGHELTVSSFPSEVISGLNPNTEAYARLERETREELARQTPADKLS